MANKMMNMVEQYIPSIGVRAFIAPDLERLGDGIVTNIMATASALQANGGVTCTADGEARTNQCMAVTHDGHVVLFEIDLEQHKAYIRSQLFLDLDTGTVYHSAEIPLDIDTDETVDVFHDLPTLHMLIWSMDKQSGKTTVMVAVLN